MRKLVVIYHNHFIQIYSKHKSELCIHSSYMSSTITVKPVICVKKKNKI